MTKILTAIFLLLACISLQVQADMKILQPNGLKNWWEANEQQTRVSLAAFGDIPWGRNIMGRLALANPIEACDYLQTDENTHPILVAQRGSCPFYLKAHYAQLAGAKMLIIADNEYENVLIKLMVDTGGQGESVHIPSALLSKQGGDKLIQSLQSTDKTISNIHIVYDFALPKKDKSDVRLWLTSSNPQTYRFLKEWQPYNNRLSKDADISPHFNHFKTVGVVDTTTDNKNCICGGRYCSTDPDGELEGTGADVVMEDLRQICILSTEGTDAWWKYINNYDTITTTSGKMEEGSKSAMLASDIDHEAVMRCVKRSFDTYDLKTCERNDLLDEEAKLIASDGVIVFPSVTINGFIYRGNLLPSTGLFEAVCESFNRIPGVCSSVFAHTPEPQDTVTVVRSYTPLILAALVFLLFFVLFVFCCYRRYLKREMYKQMVRDVNIAVSQYIAFKDDEMSTDDKDETR